MKRIRINKIFNGEEAKVRFLRCRIFQSLCMSAFCPQDCFHITLLSRFSQRLTHSMCRKLTLERFTLTLFSIADGIKRKQGRENIKKDSVSTSLVFSDIHTLYIEYSRIIDFSLYFSIQNPFFILFSFLQRWILKGLYLRNLNFYNLI